MSKETGKIKQPINFDESEKWFNRNDVGTVLQNGFRVPEQYMMPFRSFVHGICNGLHDELTLQEWPNQGSLDEFTALGQRLGAVMRNVLKDTNND